MPNPSDVLTSLVDNSNQIQLNAPIQHWSVNYLTQSLWAPSAPNLVTQPVESDNPYDEDEYIEEAETPSSGLTINLSKKKPVMTRGNKLYNYPLIEAFSFRLKKNQTDGEIGLEIECEGTNLFNAPVQYWVTHQDNSLRNHGDHPPIEYVLQKPIPRGDVPKALDYLSKKLKESGSTIDESTRTSVHVHVNCQKLTMKEVYQYILLYMIFEEILVDFSGPGRPGNLFCLRAKDAEYNVQVMENAIKTESFTEMFSPDLRYTACNTASLGKFGSLEFRSLRGTVDQELIQTWVDILLLLKDRALTYKNPQEIVEDFMKVGPDRFLLKTFSRRPDIYRLFYGRTDLQMSLWDGLRLMRDVAYAVKWEEFDPEKENKESLVDKYPGREWASNGESYRYIDSDLPEGMYFVVNVTDHTINVPRAHPVPGGTQTWMIDSGYKALFTMDHRYHSQRALTEEDMDI